LEFTWKEVKKVFTVYYTGTDTENVQNIDRCEKIINNMLKADIKMCTEEEKKILNMNWIESAGLFNSLTQNILKRKITVQILNDLMLIVSNKNILNHKIVWQHLMKTFKDRQNLVKLLHEKNKSGNFIYLLVICNTPAVIEFTLNKFKENLNDSDYQEILRSKGQFGRNLLQYASSCSKEVKTHQILWKELRDSCKSDEEFIEILREVDEDGNNVLHLAASFTTSDVFEFMISELEKLTNNKEIKIILSSFGQRNTNLLQFVVTHNKSLETNKTVWKIICKYFDAKEILEFIEHCDNKSDNLLCCAVCDNTKEIVEFTWTQIKNFINTKDAQVEYLNRKGQNGKNLHQMSLKNRANDLKVADWVQQIMQEYEMNFPAC